jgi:hypothetical protein
MKYKWGATHGVGGPVTNNTAQIVGERLAYIKAQTGAITPANVLDDARDEDTDLHPFFEWNDDKAAEDWRKQQARSLIGSISVVIEDATPRKEAVSVRAFIHVSDDDDKGGDRYEPLSVVLSDQALYAQVCARALGELRGFQKRYSQFSSLAVIAERAVNEVQLQLDAALPVQEVA